MLWVIEFAIAGSVCKDLPLNSAVHVIRCDQGNGVNQRPKRTCIEFAITVGIATQPV